MFIIIIEELAARVKKKKGYLEQFERRFYILIRELFTIILNNSGSAFLIIITIKNF